MSENMRKAVYAGSFDPPTVGHRYMIQEAMRLFDGVIVTVAVNPDKKSTFSAEERINMLVEIVQTIRDAPEGSRTPVVIVALKDQYVAQYALEQGARFMVRGIRSVADFEYERTLRHTNAQLASNVSSIFLMPPKDYDDVSSSFVKALVGPRGWRKAVRRYVTPKVYAALQAQYARKRFLAWSENPTMRTIVDRLIAEYQKPERAYHNLDHILHCLEELDQADLSRPKRQLAEAAIWFHDYVYDPAANDNEVRSAKAIPEYISSYFNGQLEVIIRATAGHRGNVPVPEVLDADLAILGQDPETYDEYAENIRKEYGFVDVDLYRQGRVAFLSKMLNRERIFRTPHFQARYETRARENMTNEIDHLEAQLRSAYGVFS